ncbi:MAG TPA: tRNA 2-thiouridine(34) synthase MnmA [Bryobacterales bacterium]|nr:tRNA 2-thiouridine(34) synthase MnmA [Bryobacterales bacterium]
MHSKRTGSGAIFAAADGPPRGARSAPPGEPAAARARNPEAAPGPRVEASRAPDGGLIAVAMSGGVDSSTVAGLLHRDRQPIVGLTMQLWNQRRLPELSDPDATSGRCCSLDDVYDARRVAEHLGVPYYVVNFEKRFEQQVVEPFVREYLAGRTPIPCTLCNNFIKFDQFLEMARQVGASRIATGHYARVERDAAGGRFLLRKGLDETKDQSYFLFGLTQEQLAHTLFPLGNLRKSEVRQLARDLGLPVADKSESQEICFVPNGDYARFVELYLEDRGAPLPGASGEIVTADGQVLGEHSGVHHFTVGQRRGLRVAAGQPLYVVSIQAESRRIVVGPEEQLLCRSFRARGVNWIACERLEAPIEVDAKIRHRFTPAPATVRPTADPDRVEVEFATPQRSVTPGQAAVFYQQDLVVGGGWIE